MVLEDVCMDCIKVLSNVTRKPHANLLLSIAYINFQLANINLQTSTNLQVFFTGLFRGAYIWM